MTAILRPLTDKERSFLLDEQTRLLADKIHIVETFLLFAWATFVFAGVPSFLWVMFWTFSGCTDGFAGWRCDQLKYGGIWAICILATSFSAFELAKSEVSGLRARRRQLESLEQDLLHGEVEETCLTIEAVKRLVDPEHFMLIYLLKTEGGAIWVRYDYDSADVEGRGKPRRTSFVTSKKLRMIRFPCSGRYHYDHGSETLRKPKAITLNLHPKDWPEDETWLDIPWDEVESRYSGKK